MATYPKDQFDELPDDLLRVGAHRGPRVGGGFGVWLAWTALASGILVASGIFYLAAIDRSLVIDLPFGPAAAETPTPTPTPTPTVEPVTDPSTVKKRNITITVLNGSGTAGLQDQARKQLTAAKWKVTSVALAATNDFPKTTVYYSDAANEDVAKGIALALGGGAVALSDAYTGAPVTVVLGVDYVPAG